VNSISGDGSIREERKPARLPLWAGILAFGVLAAFMGMLAFGLLNTYQAALRAGGPAPEFSLKTYSGEELRMNDLHGKVVLVNFWASWCKPCEAEAAEIEEAWRIYQPGGEVLFLGVNYLDAEPDALAYLERFKITYPNGPDLRTAISRAYRTRGVPETYVIGRDGVLSAIKIGPFADSEEVHQAIRPLLEDMDADY
jgi:cytochrome c biogenesis protein CcmG/thiol:disulfide interchange protein DsbE